MFFPVLWGQKVEQMIFINRGFTELLSTRFVHVSQRDTHQAKRLPDTYVPHLVQELPETLLFARVHRSGTQGTRRATATFPASCSVARVHANQSPLEPAKQLTGPQRRGSRFTQERWHDPTRGSRVLHEVCAIPPDLGLAASTWLSEHHVRVCPFSASCFT